jgi:hypothetical protein
VQFGRAAELQSRDKYFFGVMAGFGPGFRLYGCGTPTVAAKAITHANLTKALPAP